MVFYVVKGLAGAIKAGRCKCCGGEVLSGIGRLESGGR